MHDLLIGRGLLNGREVILFTTRSRASTGLYFVGLYSSSGERLWTETISSGDIWDCHYSPHGLTFLNRWEQLHVGFKK